MTDNSSSKPLRRAASETGDPFLLTPGPLTTSRSVKAAMVHDWGSRDAGFLAINKAVLQAPARKSPKAASDYVTRAGAGLRHLRGRGHADELRSAEGRQGARPRQWRLRPSGEAHPGDRPAPHARARDAGGHRARPRQGGAHAAGATPAITHIFAVHCETTLGHPQPDRRDRRARATPWARASCSMR